MVCEYQTDVSYPEEKVHIEQKFWKEITAAYRGLSLSTITLHELTCQNSTKHYKEFYSLLVTDGETETQRDTVTCPEPHSQEMVTSELEYRQPILLASELSTHQDANDVINNNDDG